MADINIYGRLWNQTTDGEIVSAAQVKDADYSGGSMFQHAINESLFSKISSIEAASNGVTWETLDVPDIVKTLVDEGDFVSGVTAETNAIKVLYGQDSEGTSISLKTINGASILGSGDITIDLSLYKVVTELPSSDIDEDKIYLVLSTASGTSNLYTEYIYVNSAWEKVGEYQAEVDLSGYVTTSDLNSKLDDYYKTSDGLLLDDNGSTLVSSLVGLVNVTGVSEITSDMVEDYFNNIYTLPTASASTLGGIKTGYTSSGKNYKVQVDDEGNAFVNVPWVDSAAGEAASVAWTNITDVPTVITNIANLSDSGSLDRVITDLSLTDETLTYSYADVDAGTDGSDSIALPNDKVTQKAVSDISSSATYYPFLLSGTGGSAAEERNYVQKTDIIELVLDTSSSSAVDDIAPRGILVQEGYVEANAFVRAGGTSDQILLADGTVAGTITEAEIDEICTI